MKYLLVIAFININNQLVLRDTGKFYDTKQECELMGELFKSANHRAIFKCYALDI